jgi:hypothetical protein
LRFSRLQGIIVFVLEHGNIKTKIDMNIYKYKEILDILDDLDAY